MKVVEHTETRLVLREVPWRSCLLGVAFLCISLWNFLPVIGLRSEGFWELPLFHQLLKLLFCLVFFLMGLVSPNELETCTLDKLKQELRLKRHHLLTGVRLYTCSIAPEVLDQMSVQVEESPLKRGVYRVNFVFEDGAICVPLTQEYFMEEYDKGKRQKELALLIHRFLGLKGEGPAFKEREEEAEGKEGQQGGGEGGVRAHPPLTQRKGRGVCPHFD
ncbi:hypothetical protein QOT17_005757 [Balamuthia mandrillaris]